MSLMDTAITGGILFAFGYLVYARLVKKHPQLNSSIKKLLSSSPLNKMKTDKEIKKQIYTDQRNIL